ncbi:MAG: SDR family oxidoreductase [Brachybacterium sp.]|nr:SDR family oxidoreductase [Brachybacterium sp.]
MTRTIVVTGAASGIGKATAERLSADGDRVMGIDLTGSDIDADLSTPDGRTAAVEQIRQTADGQIDAVVACAGIAAPIAKTVSVNYFGVVELVEALQPSLAASEAPRVAITSSFSSLQPASEDLVQAMIDGDEERAVAIGREYEEKGPEAGFVNYSSSKQAVSRWIRAVGPTSEWAGAGIALNAVGPGVVVTPMTADLIRDAREMLDAQLPMPLNGHASPEAIAAVLAFLVSEENTHMTGQTIYVDGGAESLLRGPDIITPMPPVGGDAPPEPVSDPTA